MSNDYTNAGLTNISLMRNIAFIFLAIVIAQFWLGMSINLEVNLPVNHLPLISSIFFYGKHSLYVLAHIIFGVILLILSLRFFLLSTRLKFRSLRIIGAITVTSVSGAIINGVLFLMSGQFFGFSIGMAMSAVSSIVTIAVGLYYLGSYGAAAR